jgi:hypothetical protein
VGPTHLLPRRDNARAWSTAAHSQTGWKGECARVKVKGTGQPKYNGIGKTLTAPRHSSRRGRAGRFQLPGGPGEVTHLLARRDNVRARHTAAHSQTCRKGECVRVKGRGTGQPKDNGICRTLTVLRRPTRRGRAGRFQLPGGPGEASTPTCALR